MALAGTVDGSADREILHTVTGTDALTRAFDGTRNVPESDDDWRDWVSPTAMRAYLSDDPLLDWLRLYGRDHGFQRDDELPGYDPRTDFGLFIMRKGREFEDAVVEHLGTLARVHSAANPAGRKPRSGIGGAHLRRNAARRGASPPGGPARRRDPHLWHCRSAHPERRAARPVSRNDHRCRGAHARTCPRKRGMALPGNRHQSSRRSACWPAAG